MERLGVGLIVAGGAVMLAQRGIVALLEARDAALRRGSTPCGEAGHAGPATASLPWLTS